MSVSALVLEDSGTEDEAIAGLLHLRVTLADKLHNARCIVSDLHVIGRAVFERFNKDADQLWYYRSLVEAFRSQETRGLRSPMVGELDRVVTEMERSAGA